MNRAHKPSKVACPTCGKPVVWNADASWRPFCSERCRLVDLGAWFGEEHRITGPESDPGAFSTPDDETH